MGYKFKKYFKVHGVFEGQVLEIRKYIEGSKNSRYIYTDSDMEDLSLK